MSTVQILVIVLLVLLLVGALPIFPWTSAYGYTPSGTIGVVLLIVVLVLLLR